MAYSSFLVIATVALLISPAFSLTCKSQTFSQPNTKFANCVDLPALKSFLHWNYDPKAKPDPTLSIAFIAPPDKPDGWISWALNPTATGMIGAQSFIAFKDTNGSVVVKTYNVSSYGPVVESKISYNVLDMRAEASRDLMTIFATVALPAGNTRLNQVWQVGAAVTNGVPAKHAFEPENYQARGRLRVAGPKGKLGNTPAPAPSIADAPTRAAAPTRAEVPTRAETPTRAEEPTREAAATGGHTGNEHGGNEHGGSSRVWGNGVVLCGVSMLLVASIFGF